MREGNSSRTQRARKSTELERFPCVDKVADELKEMGSVVELRAAGRRCASSLDESISTPSKPSSRVNIPLSGSICFQQAFESLFPDCYVLVNSTRVTFVYIRRISSEIYNFSPSPNRIPIPSPSPPNPFMNERPHMYKCQVDCERKPWGFQHS